MGEQVKTPYAEDVFDKLYEAVPIFAWYVSEKAAAFAVTSAEFVGLGYEPFGRSLPLDVIGMSHGYYVHIDPKLEGKTIELRNRDEVVSTITLEGE